MASNEKVRLVRNILSLSDSIIRPSNTTQYAIGDALSEVSTNEPFILTSSPGRTIEARSGEVIRASIFSNQYVATAPGLDILLFNSLPEETADNAVVAISDAVMKASCIGVLKFLTGSWSGRGNQIQFLDVSIPLKLPLSQGSLTLYGQAVLTNTYTPVSAEEFTLKMDIRLD